MSDTGVQRTFQRTMISCMIRLRGPCFDRDHTPASPQSDRGNTDCCDLEAIATRSRWGLKHIVHAEAVGLRTLLGLPRKQLYKSKTSAARDLPCIVHRLAVICYDASWRILAINTRRIQAWNITGQPVNIYRCTIIIALFPSIPSNNSPLFTTSPTTSLPATATNSNCPLHLSSMATI